MIFQSCPKKTRLQIAPRDHDHQGTAQALVLPMMLHGQSNQERLSLQIVPMGLNRATILSMLKWQNTRLDQYLQAPRPRHAESRDFGQLTKAQAPQPQLHRPLQGLE